MPVRHCPTETIAVFATILYTRVYTNLSTRRASTLFPYLVETPTGAFRYRRRVPANIRHLIAKTELVISLRTRDRASLSLRYAEVHADVERQFAEAKTSAGVSNDLLFEAALRSLRSRGLPTADVGNWTSDDRADAVDVVLAQAGIDDIEELEDRLEGGSPTELARLRQVSAEIAIVQGTLKRPRPTLTYCLRLLLEDRSRGRDLQRGDWVRYKRERERIVADLIQRTGDKEITAVTRADARSYLSHLEDAGYAPASVKKQIAFLKTLFDFGFHEFEFAGVNPFRAMRIVVPEGEDDQGVSFTYAEVRRLLTMTHTINDELQDIVRLLACTGARLGEICGLEVQDVDCVQAAITLRYNSIRRLKNKQSVRLVPIVDLASADALRRRIARLSDGKPTDSVFPRYGRDDGAGSASAALGKWLTKIGLRDTKADEVKTTHSLRHTFKDALREANIHRDIANMLQGHTAGDAASGYGSSELLEAKRQAASAVWTRIMTGDTADTALK